MNGMRIKASLLTYIHVEEHTSSMRMFSNSAPARPRCGCTSFDPVLQLPFQPLHIVLVHLCKLVCQYKPLQGVDRNGYVAVPLPYKPHRKADINEIEAVANASVDIAAFNEYDPAGDHKSFEKSLLYQKYIQVRNQSISSTARSGTKRRNCGKPSLIVFHLLRERLRSCGIYGSST